MTNEEATTALWPDWCDDHPWLKDFLRAVENEASSFGQRGIHLFHVLVAWSHEGHPHPTWFSPEAESMSPQDWLELNVFKVGFDAALDVGDGGPRPQRGCAPSAVESDVIEKLEVAHEEAAREGSAVDARHFAVALGHPNWTNKARTAVGLPTGRRELAPGRDRARTFVPSKPITAILCGGATKALRRAVEMAPRPGFVMFSWWHHQHGDALQKELRVVTRDAGLAPVLVDSREPTPDQVKAVAEAGVVYLPGGWPEEPFGDFVDTPMLEALSGCAESGGILVGNSGGALVLGAGRLSRWESGDELEPLPFFGWLEGLVVDVHVRDRSVGEEARAFLAAFPGPGLVGAGQAGAVMVKTRPLRITALEHSPGNESVFLSSPDAEPELLSPPPLDG